MDKGLDIGLDKELDSFTIRTNNVRILYEQHLCVFNLLVWLIDLGFKESSDFIITDLDTIYYIYEGENNSKDFIYFVFKPNEIKINRIGRISELRYSLDDYYIANIDIDIATENKHILIDKMKQDLTKIFKKEIPELYTLIRKKKIKKILKNNG